MGREKRLSGLLAMVYGIAAGCDVPIGTVIFQRTYHPLNYEGIAMHKLLVDIFEEHPGKTVYLSVGRFPRVTFDRGTKEVTNGFDTPLTPAKLAGIINSLITDKEGATLKKECFVSTEIWDDRYLRSIAIQYDNKSIDVRIISRLLSDIATEHKSLDETAITLKLIKG